MIHHFKLDTTRCLFLLVRRLENDSHYVRFTFRFREQARQPKNEMRVKTKDDWRMNERRRTKTTNEEWKNGANEWRTTSYEHEERKFKCEEARTWGMRERSDWAIEWGVRVMRSEWMRNEEWGETLLWVMRASVAAQLFMRLNWSYKQREHTQKIYVFSLENIM